MIGVSAVSKRFGNMVIFSEFSIDFPRNTVSCLLGPSGCGKTTLLNLMAGLEIPDTGIVHRPEQIAYVFQEPRLLPWRTVLDNAAYAMDHRLASRRRRDEAMNMLEELELSDARHLYPAQISGGMAGRVALGRALLSPSELLLLDEPMASLDPDLRDRVTEILKKHAEGKTVVLVTHDYQTAAGFSDRIYRFSPPPVIYQEVGKSELRQTLNQIENEE